MSAKPERVANPYQIDDALTAQPREMRFPLEQAGQFYISKLSIVATATPAPAKEASGKRSRKVKEAR